MTAPPRPVVLLVCGEPRRGDDAAAFAAVRLLPAEIRAVADIRPVGLLDVEDVASIEEGSACLIVDAAVGPEPGAIVRGSLASLARPGGNGTAPRSTHAMPADQVLGLAAIVRPGLPRGSFVGIGGASFGLGDGLSPDVERGIPRLAEAIAAEIRLLIRDDRAD